MRLGFPPSGGLPNRENVKDVSRVQPVRGHDDGPWCTSIGLIRDELQFDRLTTGMRKRQLHPERRANAVGAKRRDVSGRYIDGSQDDALTPSSA